MSEVELRRRLAREQREAKLHPGPGVLLHRMGGHGTIARAKRSDAQYIGAWFVDLAIDRATVQPGRINGVMAKIGKVALDDVDTPEIRFKPPVLDEDGRGFICAEITCFGPEEKNSAGQQAGQPWSIKSVVIVQVSNPDSDDGQGAYTNTSGAARPLSGNRARWPLAMLRLRDGGDFEVFQSEYFDLKHRVSLKADGKAAKRHFFY